MKFPQLDSTYEDEFGEIDQEVYRVGGELWRRQAEYFAENKLNDCDEGYRLMIKAIAKVSKIRRDNPSKIKDLSAYLFTSFKRMVFDELRKDDRHQRILDEHIQDAEVGEETEMLRKIEVEEILQKLTAQEREIFELHYIFDVSFKDIALELGMKANVLRSKMSKLRTKIRDEITDK